MSKMKKLVSVSIDFSNFLYIFMMHSSASFNARHFLPSIMFACVPNMSFFGSAVS